MTDFNGIQPKDLADALGLPACKVYSAIFKLRNRMRALRAEKKPRGPIQNCELVAAFERHSVPK